MKLTHRHFFAGGVILFAGIGTAWLAYYKLKPTEQIGPFSKTETAYIISDDGKVDIGRIKIDNNGILIQTIGNTQKVIGKIKDEGKNGFTASINKKVTLRCLTIDDSKAVCGSKRFQKSLGKFQFDRKIPFIIEELVMGSFADPGGGSATTTGTVMFKSNDSSLWMKSERAGNYQFISPTQFKITWKTPLIYTDGSNKGHVMNLPMTIRTATCTINNEIQESIICNGSTPVYGKSYSAIWKFVDSGDAKNALGSQDKKLTLKDNHD